MIGRQIGSVKPGKVQVVERGGMGVPFVRRTGGVREMTNKPPHVCRGKLSRLANARRNTDNLPVPLQPQYDLEKIKYATDAPTFAKAVGLYESGKVTQFTEEVRAYSAMVLGTKPYHVVVEARRHDYGHCDCYLGQKEVLCKHMVALAIYAVQRGNPLPEEDNRDVTRPACSGKLGTLDKEERAAVKKAVTDALKYIKPYHGPSRLWFAYQWSLSEGCRRLAKVVSGLPVGEQTARLLVDLLLRLDKKVSYGGTDDSDGTVGGFMAATVRVLEAYAALDPDCIETFSRLEHKETSFGWEEPLMRLVGKKRAGTRK